MSHQTDVIIIRGAPSVGKTELSKALAKHYPQGARVEVDVLRKMVISVNWKDQAEHIKLLALAAQTVADFARAGFCPVIVVDTFSGDKVDTFLARLKDLDHVLRVRLFGLHALPDVLASRLAARPAGEFKDFEIANRLNEETKIDTSTNCPLELCRKVIGLIESIE